MSSIEQLLVAGVLVPLAGFVLLTFFGSRLGKPLAGWVAVLAIATSTVLATTALVQWNGLSDAARAAVRTGPYLWAMLGTTPLYLGVNVDSLTLIMFFMVTVISTCIFVFSVGYMAGHSDEIDGVSKYHRFFTYLCLFDFSMLLLVIADSLVLLFISWELVGLCSYLLIGFYFHKKSASNAAMKAFITNRVGDFGFIVGLGLAFLFLQDLSLEGAAATFEAAAHHAGLVSGELSAKSAHYIEKFSALDPAWRAQFDSRVARAAHLFQPGLFGLLVATWMGMLLFCGAIGKSAQFPLHVWLPDAMEGPTPVSALIHAATMVAAGVYLTARIFVLLTPGAQLFVASIGCITLTLAALVAIVQTDIKKVLAYSTISQLGYMMLGMGVGAWIGALFHLLTHAFFKALMFLGSGQVIEGCHHEQNMEKMGGLWRKMPVTCGTFLVGVLAIAGAGIPAANIGLGGYFSKDEILAVAWHRAWGSAHHGAEIGGEKSEAGSAAVHGAQLTPSDAEGAHDAPAQHAQHAQGHFAVQHASSATPLPSPAPRWLWIALFIIPTLMAYVTPFYMLRAWWLTFMGKPRDHHVYDHAHESPLMFLPLVVLAVGTFVSSYFWFRPLVAAAAPHSFLTAAYDGHAAEAAHAHGALIDHAAHGALVGWVGFAYVAGFALAIAIYGRGLGLASRLAAALRPLHTLLVHKFYFDELYGLVLVGGTHLLKNISYAFDRFVIDGLVNLSAWITRLAARFSGIVLDQGIVDGAVNGVGRVTWGLGGLVRSPQVGRVRSYVLFAAGSVAVLVLWVAFV